jgi:histidyl-tRNA synthetase
MKFQSAKGFEDYYPAGWGAHRAIATILGRTARSFGFAEVMTPAAESFALLAKKSGEEIKQQIFNLEKKGTEQLALKPELTPGMTRMFVAKQKELPKPVKWFSIDRMWRYEAPQKGRLREFYQLSVELYGSNKVEADAEVLNLLISCMQNLGLTSDDIVLKLNNRKLLEALVRHVAGNEGVDDIIRVIDKANKVSEKDFLDMLVEAGCDQEQADKIHAIADINGKPDEVLDKIEKLCQSSETKAALAELESVLPLIPAEFVTLDLSLARGLAYYTGNVFEVFDKKGDLRAIAGGGRYDQLVELFGGEPEPATGFAIGFATLTLLLQRKKMPAADVTPDYYIAALGPEEQKVANELAARLRKHAVVETDLLGRKLDKQLKYANAIGAKKLIVIGKNEVKSGVVKVKDMASGKEIDAKLDTYECE